MNFCFLLSSERSGSNLITRLMDGHEGVCGPSPTHLFRVLLENRFRYGDLLDPGNWSALLDDAVALADAKLGTWATSVSADELEAHVATRSVGGVLRYIYGKEARAAGKGMVFVKENHIARHFAVLEAEFPGSRFVFLVRDPRDMALSWKSSPNKRGGVIRAARAWHADQADGIALFSPLAEAGRIVGVRYEELVANTRRALERVCAMLAIEYHDGMRDLERPSNRANAAATVEWANLDKPVIEDNFNKFSDGLSTDEIKFVEATCHAAMAAFGYEPTLPADRSLASLVGALEPLEAYVKPHYALQPLDVRNRHARQAAVIDRIVRRTPAVALFR